jgi:hypothetical protein
VELKEKIKLGLDESRVLVLGGQVFLGFQFRAFFQNGFEQLPTGVKELLLIGLTAIAVALALLIAITSYHRIVEQGSDSEGFVAFLSAMMCGAILPLIAGLAINLYVVAFKVLGQAGAVIFATIGGAFALGLLYGIELIQRIRRKQRIAEKQRMSQATENGPTDLKTRIDHVLTEARLVLPGAQALLGFQFLIFLTEEFERLPESLKLVHLGSLVCVTFSTILLMTPASYHRIVELGEDTAHMHNVASVLVLSATVPLGLGVAGDFFVAIYKVRGDAGAALVWSAVLLAVTYVLWFGLPLTVRTARRLQHQRTIEATNP